MVVIAVMPAAGLMISLGKLIGMYSPADAGFLQGVSRVLDTIGWAFISNMHILFALPLVIMVKERAGGAFASIIAFILINRIIGYFGVNSDMLR